MACCSKWPALFESRTRSTRSTSPLSEPSTTWKKEPSGHDDSLQILLDDEVDPEIVYITPSEDKGLSIIGGGPGDRLRALADEMGIKVVPGSSPPGLDVFESAGFAAAALSGDAEEVGPLLLAFLANH